MVEEFSPGGLNVSVIRCESLFSDEFLHGFLLLVGMSVERQTEHGAKSANFLACAVHVLNLPIVQSVFRLFGASDSGEGFVPIVIKIGDEKNVCA